ncbi:type II secretion system F family protein [Williamsia sp. 1135]|uniref:type II secretion system F family protein n=1 Tax=Williamsia sp. 1135 TaxID=1889262 RepID=UPI000A11B67D|nr:type II secretion system F family protein [Williamsia sp. 1135]ORM26841.1 type II secretion system protein F [Williamsia sp. 1135]
MTGVVFAALAGAAGLLLVPGPVWSTYRIVAPPVSHGRSREPRWLGKKKAVDDPFAAAASYDLFAVCLRSGLPVAAAAKVVSQSAPPALAGILARASDLLSLGADPLQAWAVSGEADQSAAMLAAVTRRSARAGSSPVRGLEELADNQRSEAQDRAAAAAERAGVAISGPLGLCFLPAFVCLGIVPVVMGLAGKVFGGGLL